jgi:hypothetical protein
MQKDLETLQGKTIQAASGGTRRCAVSSSTRALAFPNGHAQERTIAFVSFLNQHDSVSPSPVADLPVEVGQH